MMDGVYCVYLGGIRGICGGIAVRIYNNRERAMLNSNMSMEEFYEQVIEDFGSRLFNKFNNKEQGFDPDRIDQIKNLIKQKMQNPALLFKDALQMKHSSAGLIIPDNLARRNSHGNDVPVKKEEKEDGDNHDEEDNYAYLLRVNPNNDNDDSIMVKKEEVSPEEEPIKIEENDEDDRDDEEEKERKQLSEKLKSSLGIHIVGTYEAKAKKHIAKDEATKLELDNVFIKYKDKNHEIFCPRLVCDFKKD